MMEHKTDMNITKIEKNTKTDHDRTLNRYEHYWKTEHDGTQNRTQLHFGETSNEHIQIRQTSKLPTKKVNENLQSITNKYALFIPVAEKSEELKTI